MYLLRFEQTLRKTGGENGPAYLLLFDEEEMCFKNKLLNMNRNGLFGNFLGEVPAAVLTALVLMGSAETAGAETLRARVSGNPAVSESMSGQQDPVKTGDVFRQQDPVRSGGLSGQQVTTCEEDTDSVPPEREAYPGFVWKRISGAGVRVWVQQSDRIRVLADPSLPGIVMVRDGDSRPVTLIREFRIPGGDVREIIPQLRKSGEWDDRQTARFEEVVCEVGLPRGEAAGEDVVPGKGTPGVRRNGVKRYVLLPDGAYAREMEEKLRTEPVPATCSGWGPGNSGQRYFEVYAEFPDRAFFVEIGQEAPLFDEERIEPAEPKEPAGCLNDVAECGDGKPVCSRDELVVLDGILRLGHEVRSFLPDGADGADGGDGADEPEVCDGDCRGLGRDAGNIGNSEVAGNAGNAVNTGNTVTGEYWIVDRTGGLERRYDELTGGVKNGKPVRVRLKLEYAGKWEDGFAADYDGVFLVREILSMEAAVQ